MQVQLAQEHQVFLLGLSVVREDQLPGIAGGQHNIHHLKRGHLFHAGTAG